MDTTAMHEPHMLTHMLSLGIQPQNVSRAWPLHPLHILTQQNLIIGCLCRFYRARAEAKASNIGPVLNHNFQVWLKGAPLG